LSGDITRMTGGADSVWGFIEAACVSRDRAHSSGSLDQAERILQTQPDMATRSIYAAAVLGDVEQVQRFIELDPTDATVKGGPYEWDALTYLCFSRYLRLDRSRSDGFIKAARSLLAAGASANTGFEEKGESPPVWESALYGAAGVAHHAGVTRALIEHGADPNDEEVPYHAPETYDNETLKILVESGRLTDESFGTILLRKTDWHDYEGIKWLLEQGVNPNRPTRWGKTALHNAALSDNSLRIFEVLLDHGADPEIVARRPERWRSSEGKSATAIAARRGRADVLGLLRSRGHPIDLSGVDQLLAACAMDDKRLISEIVEKQPELVREVLSVGGRFLAEFAGNGNVEGIRNLLDLGIAVTALYETGDAYFDIAPSSTALHVAAWRAQHAALKLLIDRESPIDAVDGNGRTPLMLAVKACVDSYWTERRQPDSIKALLEAGASVSGIAVPTGYAEADALLMNTVR
jgi:ankyrin repeat protein